jgi:FkbM family methyltransferase
VLGHVAKGRADGCSVGEAFVGEEISRRQMADYKELERVSKVVEKDGGIWLWETPMGRYWMPAESGGALLFDLSEQKRDIYGTVRPGSVVVDAGANVGVFTKKALGMGAAKVIAVEPSPDNLECLRRNLAAEIAAGKVVVAAKGLWDKDDFLEFRMDPKNSARNTFVADIGAAAVTRVPVTTLDHLVRELGVERLDFIKMDIEGAEQKALAGGRETIAKFKPRMALCVYHDPTDPEMVPRRVKEIHAGYHFRQQCITAQDAIAPQVAFFE